jgi:hypothetical protein
MSGKQKVPISKKKSEFEPPAENRRSGIKSVVFKVTSIFLTGAGILSALEAYGGALTWSTRQISIAISVFTGTDKMTSADRPVVGHAREKSLGEAMRFLGKGNYQDQLDRFEAALKDHQIEEPGWRAKVVSAPFQITAGASLWCVNVGEFENKSLANICSHDSLAQLRPRDSVRFTGVLREFPYSQQLNIAVSELLEHSKYVPQKQRENKPAIAPSKPDEETKPFLGIFRFQAPQK